MLAPGGSSEPGYEFTVIELWAWFGGMWGSLPGWVSSEASTERRRGCSRLVSGQARAVGLRCELAATGTPHLFVASRIEHSDRTFPT
jgi:hypothetical protein